MAHIASVGAAAPANTTPDTTLSARERREQLRAELAAQDLSWSLLTGGCSMAIAVGTRQQFTDAGLAPAGEAWPSGDQRLKWHAGRVEFNLSRANSSYVKSLGRSGEQYRLAIRDATQGLSEVAARHVAGKMREIAQYLQPVAQRLDHWAAWDAARRDHAFQRQYRQLLSTVYLPRGRKPMSQATQEKTHA